MKALKIITALFIGLFMLISPVVGAEEVDCSGDAASSAFCKNQNTSPENPLLASNSPARRITQLIIVLAGVVSVIVMIIGGITFITSSGNPQKITTAKNTIIYASIGIVVSISAQFIVSFVIGNA